MKNRISRRSFLKAAGILGAAGALAACGGFLRFHQHGSFFHCRFLRSRFRRRFCRCEHQAVDIPHRWLGQG